jgi:uncharacterized protein YbjT (DUF2867 family)
MRILITGGTGSLGREVTRQAEAAGHTVRVASRRGRPQDLPPGREWAQLDLASGDGVAAAVSDVDAVVHAASDPLRPDRVDVAGTRHLADAARAAGVRHLVYVSIVGVDRIPLGYYRRKLAAEGIVVASGVPYSVLRATQFHTLVELVLGVAARMPLAIPLPADFRLQSVAPEEVAGRLLRAVAAGPGGRLPDFGGPEVLTVGEAAEQWKHARRVRKRVVRLPIPGRVANAFRLGMNTVPEGDRGRIRWQEWLRNRPADPGGGREERRATG